MKANELTEAIRKNREKYPANMTVERVECPHCGNTLFTKQGALEPVILFQRIKVNLESRKNLKVPGMLAIRPCSNPACKWSDVGEDKWI